MSEEENKTESDKQAPEVAEGEQVSAPSEKKGLLSPVTLVVVLLLLLGGGLYVALSTGVDKAVVTAQLERWIENIESKNPAVSISYDKVEMAGSGAKRHAVIHNVVYKTKIEQEPFLADVEDGEAAKAEPEQYDVIKTKRVELYVESASFDEYRVVFPTPIIHTKSDGEQVEFTTSEPVSIAYELTSDEGESAYHFEAEMPRQITSKRTGDLIRDSTVVLTIGEESMVDVFVYENPLAKGALNLTLNKVSAQKGPAEGEPDRKFLIGQLQSKWQWRDLDKEQTALSVLQVMEDGEFYGSKSDTKEELSLAFDADYSGPSIIDKSLREIDWSSKKALLELRELSIETSEATLKLDMTMQTGQGERAPIGEGSLQLNGFDKLLQRMRAEPFWDERQEKTLAAIIQLADGRALDDVEALELPLKRESGQSFMVGKAPLEAFLLTYLTRGQLTGVPNTDAKKTPAEDLDEAEVKELFDEQK